MVKTLIALWISVIFLGRSICHWACLFGCLYSSEKFWSTWKWMEVLSGATGLIACIIPLIYICIFCSEVSAQPQICVVPDLRYPFLKNNLFFWVSLNWMETNLGLSEDEYRILHFYQADNILIILCMPLFANVLHSGFSWKPILPLALPLFIFQLRWMKCLSVLPRRNEGQPLHLSPCLPRLWVALPSLGRMLPICGAPGPASNLIRFPPLSVPQVHGVHDPTNGTEIKFHHLSISGGWSHCLLNFPVRIIEPYIPHLFFFPP